MFVGIQPIILLRKLPSTPQRFQRVIWMPPLAKFPELPSRSSHAPWPAAIVDGHNTLKATYDAASRALNLDESDPIRLQHYEKQTKTLMLSTLEALAACGNPSLPEHYIEDIANLVRELAQSMTTALSSSLKRCRGFRGSCSGLGKLS